MSPIDFWRGEGSTARTTFEETYPQHEFSELVRLGLALGARLARGLGHLRRRGPGPLGEAISGEIKPAE